MKRVRPTPPQLFLRFFRWFCSPDMASHIEGDMMELYYERAAQKGKFNADCKFVVDVLLLFRPGIIRQLNLQPTFHYGILKSSVTSGWRNMLRNRKFSFINITGLSLGLTCSILILLWVRSETMMNSYHQDIDRIYVVTSCEFSGDERNGSHDTPGLLGEELKSVIPEVEFSCSYAWYQFHNFSVDDKLRKLNGNFASEDYFKIFSYPFLLGDRNTALNSPESIVISRTMAKQFFGSPEAAIDQTIRYENWKDLKVTGVFEDIDPQRYAQKFNYIINWKLFTEQNPWIKVWHNSGPTTYLKLHNGASAERVNAKIRHFIKKYDNEYSELDRLELGLQPFSEKYLHSNFKNGYVSGGRIEYVRLFTIVAIFILVIACINFMNLSTARATKRALEIGVRKVNGAIRNTLVYQFLVEAMIYVILAVVVAIALLHLALPSFNLLTGKTIVSPVNESWFWIGIASVTLFTGIFAGSYPAFLLSSFKPILVLKGKVSPRGSSTSLRKGLVAFQFALSMILIVGTVVVSQQVNYIHTKNLGYSRDNMIFVSLSGATASNFETFKEEALKISGVSNVTYMSQRPIDIDNSTGSVAWEGKPTGILPTFTQAAVGYDFIKTMKAELVNGRDFSPLHADSSNYIINEAALKIIGYDDPIGKPLTFWGNPGSIIGVVKNFHFNSLHVPIQPIILRLKKDSWGGLAIIRIADGKLEEAISGLEALHQKLNPDYVFAHQFADEEYRYLYTSEQVVQDLSKYFAGIAIIISCLGLLGLVIFTTEQRSKEVGIRKVLGASVPGIVGLLSKDYIKLVVISTLMSTPVAWYIMDNWLQGFEYRTQIQWWIFPLAAILALAVAVFAVGIHATKSALQNPVDSLRSE